MRLAILDALPYMREIDQELDLRTATMDVAEIVAELESARDPDDPRDPTMLRFWWATRSPDETHDPLIELHRELKT
ncbi:MAG TPA: hypothetical protein VNG70_08240 [Candidatus Limnocylindria bacterium]|nr:hypothetical protein [Candidatus Limnocylindria bacterium]